MAKAEQKVRKVPFDDALIDIINCTTGAVTLRETYLPRGAEQPVTNNYVGFLTEFSIQELPHTSQMSLQVARRRVSGDIEIRLWPLPQRGSAIDLIKEPEKPEIDIYRWAEAQYGEGDVVFELEVPEF